MTEDLTHYGVKGMKWGKRKRYSSNDILAARHRQSQRINDAERDKLNRFDDARKKAGFTREDVIRGGSPSKSKIERYNKYAIKANMLYMEDMAKVISHPDADIANKMTRGEKALTATMLAAPFVGAAIFKASV